MRTYSAAHRDVCGLPTGLWAPARGADGLRGSAGISPPLSLPSKGEGGAEAVLFVPQHTYLTGERRTSLACFAC